jgi:excisionase family DNA binding protein
MAQPDAIRDLIGSDEAARLLGVDRATVLRWREDDTITAAVKMPGPTGAYLFHRADVEKLAADRAAKAVAS